jgi:phosphoglycerol transferase MdoB-like AlkP superfamily enzyme
MLTTLINFCRFIFYWLVIFFLTRLIFVVYFHDKLQKATWGEVGKVFLYGIRMDLSTAGYISILPLLLFFINLFLRKTPFTVKWLKGYVIFCLVLIAFTTIVDLNIFQEWGIKVNFRVFNTLYQSPSEAVASTGSSPIGLSLTIGIGFFVAAILLSNLIINYRYERLRIPLILKPVVILALAFVNVMFIRGGLQVAPMNTSMAYFSSKQILNQSAINTQWSLIHNTLENLKTAHNPYLFMPEQEADKLVAEMFTVKVDTTVSFLKTPRPNIVIVQMESFTADLIESLGGEKGDAPNFEKFTQQGVLFDSIYAAGERTDKGIIAIMSGFPAQATRTIITDNVKQEKLPAISVNFKKAGYHTSYFYGGESEYMNFKSYLLSHQMEQLIDKRSFSGKDMNSKWGAHDDVVMDKHAVYLATEKKPFFSYLQTLSNHEPFELPVKPHFSGEDVANKFRSTAYYTDSSLNAYIEQAKKQGWYKNTLFVLVADHGHRLPLNTSEAYHPSKYHIPLLFFGDAIKDEFKGKRIHKLGNQTDVAATLLAQLGLPHQEYTWSKNLMNPYSKDFAFFDWDNGFGFMLPGQAVAYDNAGQRVIAIKDGDEDKGLESKDLLYGKAFLQKIFTEYMKF